MKLLRLEVQGFRSFTIPQTLDFTKLRPGLYHLSGRNETEPFLEGNGAGKSSLLEAVCWGLYGRTSRNLKAGSVKSWGSKEKCAVMLDLQTDAGEVSVFRVWQPNTLEVSVNGTAKPLDQKELESLLGLSPEAFLFSIYFAQFTPSFIDLRPAEQMAVYSTVLGLNLWEQAADHAAKHGRELEGQIAQQREKGARLDGEIKSLEALSFDAEEKAWEKGRTERLGEIDTVGEEAEKLLTTAKKEAASAKRGAERCRAFREQMIKSNSSVAIKQSEVARLERDLKALQAKDYKVCPTCGQTVTNEHIKKEVARVKSQHAVALAEQLKLVANHQELQQEYNKLTPEEGKLLDAERSVASLTAQLKSLAEQSEQAEAEKNPYTAKRIETEVKIKTLRDRRVEAEALLQEVEAEQKGAQFWSKGFKELRLSLIEESLLQLVIESNAALVELGLKDWSLGFDVERETKSGSISKGFTVSVQAPHMADPVPWEVWSGGESQRLRVASSLGFAELICSRMGMQPNVELYDEPSTWLSAQGIDDLLRSLQARAERRGKVILLADHRALDFGGFAGVINVIKTKAGSEISL